MVRLECTEEGCEAFFTKASHLERHKLVHTRVQSLACPHCSRRFGRLDSMRRHISRKHKSAEAGAEGPIRGPSSQRSPREGSSTASPNLFDPQHRAGFPAGGGGLGAPGVASMLAQPGSMSYPVSQYEALPENDIWADSSLDDIMHFFASGVAAPAPSSHSALINANNAFPSGSAVPFSNVLPPVPAPVLSTLPSVPSVLQATPETSAPSGRLTLPHLRPLLREDNPASLDPQSPPTSESHTEPPPDASDPSHAGASQITANIPVTAILRAPRKPLSVSTAELLWYFARDISPVCPILATWTFADAPEIVRANPVYLLSALMLASSRHQREEVRNYAHELGYFALRTTYVRMGSMQSYHSVDALRNATINFAHGHWLGLCTRDHSVWLTNVRAYPGGCTVARSTGWWQVGKPPEAWHYPGEQENSAHLRERWISWHARERIIRTAVMLGIIDSQQSSYMPTAIALQALLASTFEPGPSAAWLAKDPQRWKEALATATNGGALPSRTLGELACALYNVGPMPADPSLPTDPFTLWALLEALHASYQVEKRALDAREHKPRHIDTNTTLPADFCLPLTKPEQHDVSGEMRALRERTSAQMCTWLAQWGQSCGGGPSEGNDLAPEDQFQSYLRWHAIQLELLVNVEGLLAVTEPGNSIVGVADEDMGRAAFHAGAILSIFLGLPQWLVTPPHSVHGACLALLTLVSIGAFARSDVPTEPTPPTVSELITVPSIRTSLAVARSPVAQDLGLLLGLERPLWKAALRNLYNKLNAMRLDWCLVDKWLRVANAALA